MFGGGDLKDIHMAQMRWYTSTARHLASLSALWLPGRKVLQKKPCLSWRMGDNQDTGKRGALTSYIWKTEVLASLGGKMMWPFKARKKCCQISFPLKQKLCWSLDNYHWAVPSWDSSLSQEAPQELGICIYNHLPPNTLVFRTKLHSHHLGFRSDLDLTPDLPISTKLRRQLSSSFLI